MPFQTSRATREGRQAVVYKYKVRGIPGDDLGPLIAELQRQYALRALLVDIEDEQQTRLDAIWRSHPDVGPLLKDLAVKQSAAEELAAEVRRLNASARSSQPGDERADELDAAWDEVRAARDAVKEAKAAGKPLVAGQLRDASKTRDAAVAATYAPSVAGGLCWSTVNDTVAKHNTAVQKMIKDRTEGRRAQMRHHDWDGTGTLRVQLQRGADAPPRTPAMLAGPASPWANVAALRNIILDPGEWDTTPVSVRKRGELRLRIGQDNSRTGGVNTKRTVTLPLVYHRQLPPDADITDVRFTRRRTLHTYECWVTFTCLLPVPPPVTEGSLAVVHIGWRVLPDGALRAAVVAGPPPPRNLVDLGLVRWYGGWGEIVTPARLRSHLEKLQDIQGTATENFTATRDWLVEWIAKHPGTREVLDPDGTLAGWLSADLLADLTRRSAYLADDPLYTEAVTWLQAWEEQDYHLRKWIAFGRENIIGWRQDAYRQAAAWLTSGGVAQVVVDGWRVPTRRAAGENRAMANRARANARLVSPGELRQVIQIAGGRRGVKVVEPSGVKYGMHQGCGGNLPREERSRAALVRCTRCDHMVDQDVNAVRALAAAAERGELAE